MTQLVGAALAVALVVTLLAREAVATGAIQAPPATRHRLNLTIAALATMFLAVVAFHLLTL